MASPKSLGSRKKRFGSRQQVTAARQQLLPFASQVNPPVGPVEKAYFKVRFELLDLARKRGLRKVQQFRRFRDISNLAGFYKCTQLTQVDVMSHFYG